MPDARLVVSGRPPPYVIAEPGILATGYIDDDAMPSLVSALDVACIITANSAFGRCSYPAKLCEAMACQVPVVATSTAPVRWMLGDDSRFLVPIGDPDGIAEGILSMLRTPQSDYGELPTWTTSAALLEQCLLSVG